MVSMVGGILVGLGIAAVGAAAILFSKPLAEWNYRIHRSAHLWVFTWGGTWPYRWGSILAGAAAVAVGVVVIVVTIKARW